MVGEPTSSLRLCIGVRVIAVVYCGVTTRRNRWKHLEGSLASSIHTRGIIMQTSFQGCPQHMAPAVCMCMSSLPTMPQLRWGQQLCPVGLATLICQLSVLLGLGLLISADSLGPCLPDLSSLHLLNVTVDALHGLDSGRKFFILGPSGPWSQLTAVVGTYAYVLVLWPPITLLVCQRWHCCRAQWHLHHLYVLSSLASTFGNFSSHPAPCVGDTGAPWPGLKFFFLTRYSYLRIYGYANMTVHSLVYKESKYLDFLGYLF
jgi:hypothetical protein